MLTTCAENISRSFLLQDDRSCDCSLPETPLSRSVSPHLLLHLYIKSAEFPGCCWYISIRAHDPSDPTFSVCTSVISSFQSLQSGQYRGPAGQGLWYPMWVLEFRELTSGKQGKTTVTSASVQRKVRGKAFLYVGCKPQDEQALEIVMCLCSEGVWRNHGHKVKG